MQLAAIGLVVGIVAGLVAGGRPDWTRLRTTRQPWLLLVALALYAVPWLFDDLPGEGTLVALALGTTLVWAGLNWALTGMPVLIVGLALNLVPLALNGAIPVGRRAAVTAEIGTFDDIATRDLGVGRRLEVTDDRFVFLADTLPVKATGWVVSFGDLIIAAGVANVVFRLLRPLPSSGEKTDAFAPPSRATADDDDAWTAMLRGDISEDTYKRRTGSQEVIDATDSSSWGADSPLPTGPVVLPDARPAAEPGTGAAEDDDVDLTVLAWKSPTDEAPPDVEPTHVHDTGPIDVVELDRLLAEQEAEPTGPAAPPAEPEAAWEPPGPAEAEDDTPRSPMDAVGGDAIGGDEADEVEAVEEVESGTGPVEEQAGPDATPAPPPAPPPPPDPAPELSDFERALARFDERTGSAPRRGDDRPIFEVPDQPE